MTTGHHRDGSSVQNHSCGSHYPFVVGVQEHPDGRWFVMHPNGLKHRYHAGEWAFEAAEWAARLKRDSAAARRASTFNTAKEAA